MHRKDPDAHYTRKMVVRRDHSAEAVKVTLNLFAKELNEEYRPGVDQDKPGHTVL
jgi:hypothetical protein